MIPLEDDVAFFTLRMSTGVAAMVDAMVGGTCHVGFLTLAPSWRERASRSLVS